MTSHRVQAARARLRRGSIVMAAVVVSYLLTSPPAIAVAAKPRSLSTPTVPAVHGTPVRATGRPADLTQGATAPRTAHVSWPRPGSAVVSLPAAPSSGARPGGAPPIRSTGPVRAPGLPVALAAEPGANVSALTVSVVDRATVPVAWRNGVVLRLARADGVTAPGRTRVTIDDAAFADGFGGDYAARLRLVQLPSCALDSNPGLSCRVRPIPSVDDASARTVTADVGVPAAGQDIVLALAAGASSTSGTFAATPLKPSSTWTAGGNSGDFSWQYPIATPPGLGGPAPTVALSYSSSSVDGRNATTNNQPNWVGEGFDYTPGQITRTYKPCVDDEGGGANNTTDTGDECWGTDNAVLSLSGHSGELIKDGATGTWRIKGDDNSKIEHLTGAVNADNDGEYWRLTAADGTRYYFGLNRLPGYTGTAPANKMTNSAWTVPVAGNNAAEPCHATGFTASFCAQAWQWNLDYVVDTHGNSMSVFYTQETNKYARNNTDSDVQTYVRGGYVDHIDYGTDQRGTGGTDTEETATVAPMRVQFATADRCLSACSTHDVAHWPDTPWDQSCTSSASCPGIYSPVFFTTRRLATITTEVAASGATCGSTTGFKCVDQWTLTHDFPPSGDDTRNGMWLDSIVRTGEATGGAVVGSSVSLPAINFDWTQMPNRVDTDAHNPPMNWMRLSTIWTEAGGKISIRYTPLDCTPTSLPTSPQANTRRCYPVLEEQPDKSIKTEYFNRYLVSAVTQTDTTGGGIDVVTSYTYVGNPGWRHADDDGLTKDNLRTWSNFRGYPQVNTQVGAIGQGQQTLSETTYFQGMNGDLNGSGSTRSVTLAAIDVNGDGDTADLADAPAVTDDDAFSGQARQSTVFNGSESAPVSATVYQPWQSAPTATRDMGQTTVYARHTGIAATWTGVKLTAGGWRVTRSNTTFDSYGMTTQVDNAGDIAVTGDETCSKSSYNRNTVANLLESVSEEDVYTRPCATAAASDADVISMNRTFYDHHAFTTAPTKGEATETDEAKAWALVGGVATPTWLPTSTSSYDAWGRPADVTDVRGNHTTTVYNTTTNPGGPVTTVATTTVLGTSTNTLEPSWGAVTALVDLNNKLTDTTYDALGRTSQVWGPTHPKASFPSQPSASFAYLIRATGGVNAVTTSTLNAANAYTVTYALFDGLDRARQTQTVSLANGHVGTVFADTVYDDKGQAVQRSDHFDPSVQPSTTLFAIQSWQPHNQTVTQYDLAGRATVTIVEDQGVLQSRTTTTYGGDRVSVVPPAGGVATTTVSDGQGRAVELRQYHNAANVGSNTRTDYDLVTYHYNRKGQQDSWTDNAGNTWTATFDFLGRATAGHDPDKGNASSVFNDAGDLLSTTDGNSQTLAYTYDTLGRKTGEYLGTTTGAKLATFAYDPTGAKGQLASQSRWIGTDEYRIKINGYTADYKPTSIAYTIPATQAGLAGTYTFGYSYKPDGSPATFSYPNAGGIGAETLTYSYNATDGLANQLQTNFPNAGNYVVETDYNANGQVGFEQFQQTAGNFLQRSFTYDDQHRLSHATTIRQVGPQPVDDTTYQYDPSGNIAKSVETPAAGAVDTQCYAYDYAARLSDAWTPASGDCTVTKSAATLGGPAPYWLNWTFDVLGDRRTQASYATNGNTTSTSSYPASGVGSVRPHAVTFRPDHRTRNQHDDELHVRQCRQHTDAAGRHGQPDLDLGCRGTSVHSGGRQPDEHVRLRARRQQVAAGRRHECHRLPADRRTGQEQVHRYGDGQPLLQLGRPDDRHPGHRRVGQLARQ